MRASVIVSEYLVYVPAIIIFLRHYTRAHGVGTTSASVALVAILMQPSTILVDHGHFQYNTVMLGFVVATLSSLYAGRLLWACVFFVAAIGFKQMALYYSPVIFAYLLGSCLAPHLRPGRLLSISVITLLAFTILFAPLLIGALYDEKRNITLPEHPDPPLLQRVPVRLNTDSFLHVVLLQTTQTIHRCFPFARGVFEDKVANFWCTLNTFYKLRNLEGIADLSRISLYLTLISVLAPLLIIGAIPRKSLLPYALASSAWGFFLFSFQVHEKSVLLPLLPMTLLLGSKDGLSKEYRAWIGWANLLGAWTMYPLLKRDELRTPYVVVSLLWAYLLGLPPTSVSAYYDPKNENVMGRARPPDDLHTMTKILHFQYYVLMAFWHLLEAFAEPPEGKPDLWVVVNACFGAVGFGICYLWCTWKLVLKSGLLDEYFVFRGSQHSKVNQAANASARKTQ
jgi:alpha-1,3-glucosyltransferase